ncbi:hypothetical protein TWF281_006354 [Arthrobotrys megalospora]
MPHVKSGYFLLLLHILTNLIEQVQAATEPNHYRTKIGTLDQYVEIHYLILETGFRKNEEFKEALLEWSRTVALAPRASNVYATESVHFGLLAVSISVGPKQEAAYQVPDSFNKGLSFHRRIFGDDLFKDEEAFQEEKPIWLDDDKDEVYFPPPTELEEKTVEAQPRANTDRKSAATLSNAEVDSKIVDEVFLDLQVISQPQRTTQEELQGRFWNYKKPGRDQVVYVVDSGCDMDHPEVSDVNFRADWIFTGAGFPADEMTDTVGKSNGKHGTSVIGRVAGKHTGVAHDAEIVVVKMTSGRGVVGTHDITLDSLVRVYEDCVDRMDMSGRNCIVNFSWVWEEPNHAFYNWHDATQEELSKFGVAYNRVALDVLQAFAKLPNAVIFGVPGNDAPGTEPGSYPSKFLATAPELRDKLIIVGGYNPRTGLVAHNFADYIRIFAPSVYVNAAALYTDGELWEEYPSPESDPIPNKLQKQLQLEFGEGTSLACPTVAGVLATFLSAGLPMDKAIQYLFSQAYPRAPGGPNAVYNGIGIYKWPESLWPEWYTQEMYDSDSSLTSPPSSNEMDLDP